MDELFGLPAHPLIVHAPIVLLPLAALGVVAMLIRPSWYLRYRWATLTVGVVGAIGAFLATSSGEELEGQVEESGDVAAARAINEHAEAGDLARTAAIVFAGALIAYVVVPWFLARRASTAPTVSSTDGASLDESATVGSPGWLRPVLMVIVAIAAAASVFTVIDAGHSGSAAVWNERVGERDEGGDDG